MSPDLLRANTEKQSCTNECLKDKMERTNKKVLVQGKSWENVVRKHKSEKSQSGEGGNERKEGRKGRKKGGNKAHTVFYGTNF